MEDFHFSYFLYVYMPLNNFLHKLKFAKNNFFLKNLLKLILIQINKDYMPKEQIPQSHPLNEEIC